MRWMNLNPIAQDEVSQKEKDKYHVLMLIYMESRKVVMMNLFAGQQRRHRHKNQTFGHSEEGRGWESLRR